MAITSNFTARGIYPVTSSGMPGKNRDMFGEAVKFFDQIPSWQRIASYGGTSGTGLGTTGDPDPAGELAFAVWRALSASQPYDIIVKWSWSSFYSANQLEIGSSNYGFGIGVAFHGSSAAWNGTTNNDLLDIFPAGTPWKSGSLVFPRQNELGGAHATEGNRQYIAAFSIDPPAAGRMVCIGDDDWFFMHLSASAKDTHWFYFGPYIPISATYTEPKIFNYVMLSAEQAEGFDLNKFYGNTTENNTKNSGITYTISSSAIQMGIPRVGAVRIGTISSSFSSETKINFSGSGVGPVNEYPLILYSAEETYPPGALGYIEDIRAINSDLNNYDFLSTAGQLILSGNTNLSSYAQMSIPYTSSLTGSLPEGQNKSLNINFLTSSLFTTGEVGTVLIPIFRGENPPGIFVYNEGSPPPGATNITLIGFK